MSALAVIGRLDIPHCIRDSQRYRELLQFLKYHERGEISGTEDDCGVEMYAWKGAVDAHTDNTGFVYIVPIRARGAVLHAGIDESVALDPGIVVRLDDSEEHWTTGGSVIALFLGSYRTRRDSLALQKLRRYLADASQSTEHEMEKAV